MEEEIRQLRLEVMSLRSELMAVTSRLFALEARLPNLGGVYVHTFANADGAHTHGITDPGQHTHSVSALPPNA